VAARKKSASRKPDRRSLSVRAEAFRKTQAAAKARDSNSVVRSEEGGLMGSSASPPQPKARKPFMRKDPRPARKKKPVPPPSRRSMDELKKTRKTRR
jgi:hypothetical protein